MGTSGTILNSLWIISEAFLPTAAQITSGSGIAQSTSQAPGDAGPVPIPNDASHHSNRPLFKGARIFDLLADEEGAILAFGSLVGGILFGAPHCLAWNFQFPTFFEQMLWRICSIITTFIPLIATAPIAHWVRAQTPYDDISRPSLDPHGKLTGPFIFVAFILPYLLARLFIMVEIFRTLFHLPPEAFIETWSGAFPHWG